MNINFIANDIVNMAIDWCKKNDCLDHAEYIEANRRELFKKFRPICEDFILNIIYDPNMLIDTSKLRDRTIAYQSTKQKAKEVWDRRV